MANIVLREDVTIAWIYLAKCYPKNLIQFPLDLYLYIGQTLHPDIRPEQHMTEDKNNPKFIQLRSLTTINDWNFVFLPVLKKCGESFKNYMNRTGIEEKQKIREFETNYLRYGFDSYGLNASDGGEHPANGGYRTFIPGETTGVKHISYRKDEKSYRYIKNIWQNDKNIAFNEIFKNRNLFIVYLYAKSVGEKNIIIDKNIFWDNVKKWWNDDIYNARFCRDYLGIKRVSVSTAKTCKRGFHITHQSGYGSKFHKSKALFSNFLELYQDGILDIDDIFCLDFFVWNAKLILESKFDIKNKRPDVFYDDFFKFRKIHHFSVDNLGAAIEFLRVVESLTDNKLPVGQQRLQCT